jgi:plastocyanin
MLLGVFLLGAAVSVLYAFPQADAQNATNSTNATGSGSTVSIVPGSSTVQEGGYEPSPLTVSKGTTVTFVNDDSTLHTVVAGSAAAPIEEGDPKYFASEYMPAKATFEQTFTEAVGDEVGLCHNVIY